MVSPASHHLHQNSRVVAFGSLSRARRSVCMQASLQSQGFTHHPRRQGKHPAHAAALLVPQPEPGIVLGLETNGAKADDAVTLDAAARSLLQLVLRVREGAAAPSRTAALQTQVPTHAGLVLAVGLRLKVHRCHHSFHSFTCLSCFRFVFADSQLD